MGDARSGEVEALRDCACARADSAMKWTPSCAEFLQASKPGRAT